jgi:hypothetical protein
MKHAIAPAAFLIMVSQISQPSAQTNTVQLSDQDKAVVIEAVIGAKSHQQTPKEFTPVVGASVPEFRLPAQLQAPNCRGSTGVEELLVCLL